MDWIVGGIRNNRAIAQTQGEKNLCSCLPPNLHIEPDFQLEKMQQKKILLSQ